MCRRPSISPHTDIDIYIYIYTGTPVNSFRKLDVASRPAEDNSFSSLLHIYNDVRVYTYIAPQSTSLSFDSIYAPRVSTELEA